MTVESPCIKLCQIDQASQLCIGCRRSLDEIARWSQATDAEKRRILDVLEQRPQRPAPIPTAGS